MKDDIRRRMRKGGLSLTLGTWVGLPVAYYLNDNFTTARLAGAVHGTAAEPGPGTRTVVDGGSLLQITGGILTVAVGGAAGDPGYWLGSTSRVLGKMAIVETTASALGNNGYDIGFDINQSGPVVYSAVNVSAIALYFRLNGLAIVCAPAISTGTTYKIAVILKTIGCYYLIKGGVYSKWTLIGIDTAAANNAATLYPGLSTSGATSGARTSDFIRIPTLLWTPKPIFADSFGGTWPTTDGGGLTGLEAGGSGKTWIDDVGAWAIAAGSASCTTDGGVGIATVDAGKSDVYHWAKVTLAGGVVGLVTNYVDANNHVKIYHDGVTTVKVDEVVGGVATNRLTYNNAAIAYAANSDLVARGIDGGASKSVYVWYKNVFCNAAATISDATIRVATKHGIYTTNNGNTFSEAFTYAVGSGGEYSNPLNMFIN